MPPKILPFSNMQINPLETRIGRSGITKVTNTCPKSPMITLSHYHELVNCTKFDLSQSQFRLYASHYYICLCFIFYQSDLATLLHIVLPQFDVIINITTQHERYSFMSYSVINNRDTSQVMRYNM